MADVKTINGYSIKDETARNGLLNKQDIMQYLNMPTASSTLSGKLVQYTGSTSQMYKRGYFYRCEYSSSAGGYVWTNVKTQDDPDFSVDFNKKISHYETLPSDENWGAIVQYIGSTNANYTEGFFYKAYVALSNVVTPSGISLTIADKDVYLNYIKGIESIASNIYRIDHFTITVQLGASDQELYGYTEFYNANNIRVNVVSNYKLSEYEQRTGLKIEGNVSENDVITADVIIDWEQIDVQPAVDISSALRNKDTSTSTTFVDTRAGTTQYPTTGATLTNSTIIGYHATVNDNSTNYNNVTVYGSNAQVKGNATTALGYNARALGDQSTAIGHGYINSSYSVSINGLVYAPYSVSIGHNATVNSGYGVAIGNTASATNINAVALGADAVVNATSACQLGRGTNSNQGTLQFLTYTMCDQYGFIPLQRLSIQSKFASWSPSNLYDDTTLRDNDNIEYAILYTGETNSVFNKEQCYKSVINYSRPVCIPNADDNTIVKTSADIIVDQEKFFLKIAEISQERIDDDDLANSFIAGAIPSQSLFFRYNGSTQKWRVVFELESLDSGLNNLPNSIENISDLSDFGIYLSPTIELPTGNQEYAPFEIGYQAPNYCDEIDAGEYLFNIDYIKFMDAMCSSTYGFAHVINNMQTWQYEVNGTTHNMPIIPKTYQYDGDDYDDVVIRFGWEPEEDIWDVQINGNYLLDGYTTAQLASIFGIVVNPGDEADVDYIYLDWYPARQLDWRQFNPFNEVSVVESINGFDKTKKQHLIHDVNSSSLKWEDIV